MEEALGRPILKKNGLDTVFKNYWPVSNLSFIWKVTDRAVFLQVDNDMKKHDLYPSLQSAYRNTIVQKQHFWKLLMTFWWVWILSMLFYLCYLTWALTLLIIVFCCIDCFGLSRSCQQEVNGFPFPAPSLTVFLLTGGVPQGSCLGPLLYIIYSSKLFNIIERHPPNSHCYADDSQIYLSFKPDDLSIQQDAITGMQNCIDDFRSWMEHDKLLSDEKMQFLVIGTQWQLSKVNISLITVGNSVIIRSSVVRNLGSYIDDKLSMNSHINKVCNASFYYLHNIRWIRKHLSRHSSETLIHAFVSSWLDYCNSLLYELR